MDKDTMLNRLGKIFEAGIDLGLLLAEEERDSEDLFDATGCYFYALKNCVPSVPVRRRQPRSRSWREAKNKSSLNFIKVSGEILREIQIQEVEVQNGT